MLRFASATVHARVSPGPSEAATCRVYAPAAPGFAPDPRPMSLDSPVLAGDDDLTLVDTVGSEDPEYSHVDYHESLQVLLARLPKREQRIISLRFYGNLTQVEIAEKVGLSQMHVSRLLRHSLEFLKRGLEG